MASVGSGRFITLEGGEGAGKSTQIRLLAGALRKTGLTVVETREPGGAPGAEAIRELLIHGSPDRWDPMTEALLHFAARRQHLVETVFPALERGDWVISDRFADSTMAYQGAGQGVGTDAIQALYRLVLGDFAPDLTLILDLDPETGLARAQARGDGADRYERMGAAFHASLRQAFLDIAAREPRRCAVIDAAGTPESVHQAVLAAIRDRLAPDGL